MHMASEDQYAIIIKELSEANQQLKKQNSLSRMLWVGVVYGIGFFIGSAIIATIALGVFGPYVGQIPWVQNAFVTGKSLLQ